MNVEAPQHDQPQRGRVAGIDFGTVRIGIAIEPPETSAFFNDARRLLAPALG